MDKRRLTWITWAVLGAAIVIAALMLGQNLSRTAHITLPSSDPPRESAAEGGAGPGGPAVVEITPETAQSAIASLSRPESYGRSVTVEYFWNGGGGRHELYTAVRDGWTRTDRALPDGRTRTSATNGEVTYIWYDGGEAVCLPAGDISADTEQSIPTYEDLLALPPGEILAADYQALEGEVPCIYVETPAARWWVSVESGLLARAERLEGETVVYRMTSLRVDQTGADRFVLPDGTPLLEEGG